MITSDDIIYAEETNFNEKDITCKTQNFYILHAFSLIAIQINGEIMINVDVSVKNIYVEKIIFGILVHVFIKVENI